jgi:hypothetical protein
MKIKEGSLTNLDYDFVIKFTEENHSYVSKNFISKGNHEYFLFLNYDAIGIKNNEYEYLLSFQLLYHNYNLCTLNFFNFIIFIFSLYKNFISENHYQ